MQFVHVVRDDRTIVSFGTTFQYKLRRVSGTGVELVDISWLPNAGSL